MEILTITAFALFLMVFVYLVFKMFINTYCFGFLRSFETRTNNWFFVVLILVNIIIVHKLYYLI